MTKYGMSEVENKVDEMRIKLSEFNPEKHRLLGYYSNRGTELGVPSLPYDYTHGSFPGTARESKISQLLEALKKDAKAKAHFLIYSGSLGGYGSRWYLLKNVYVDVEER